MEGCENLLVINYPRSDWLRGLDLNQRPSGYEPDAPYYTQAPSDLINNKTLPFLTQLLITESYHLIESCVNYVILASTTFHKKTFESDVRKFTCYESY